MKIEIFDTTLRDGAQGEGISFSLQDKLAVLQALDDLGVAWIEAGNPGSNPKDMEFFRIAQSRKLKTAKLCAFGSTRRKGMACKDDTILQGLLDAATEAVVIFGKSWDLHVTEVLKVSLEENLAMISETVAYLKDKGRTVIYDAEHFFDGWVANPEYALKTIQAAAEAGASRIVLCDTNGGSFPDRITGGVTAALAAVTPVGAGLKPAPTLGIHTHNDSGMATAGAITAVQAGCTHVQGTLIGFGERCGNTALAEVIPGLELKLKMQCLPEGNIKKLYQISRQIAEIANISLPDGMPYIGNNAFSHKAGMHADGILKVRQSFEHIDPALVGNDRQFLISEVGGRSIIAERAKKIDAGITKDSPVTANLANKLKSLEAEGWQFEGADASFELLVRRELGKYKALFTIETYQVTSEFPSPLSNDGKAARLSASAWVKVLVDGNYEIAAAEGDGPVNALDGALRRALIRFYPELEQIRLSDYKVRVIDGSEATASRVRVLIESTDGVNTWNTVGVSGDVIEASRLALVDSLEYKLIGDIERRFKAYL
ncbi:MAG: citramalate synthase [Spirochaetaceae bacterium]|nr:citramalate synthase [Spirochaetaceae bacterium]